ncbi:MAG: PmoA family protein, partial [Sedimentisphaerales bacterium]|nr:PmoA family protein [Sedimentisphaerales bacterium]
VGLFFCVDNVNGTNFWNYYRNPGGKEPKIEHVKFEKMEGGDGRGELRTVAHWIDKNEQLVLEEKRGMTFISGEHKDEYAIDFEVDLTAQVEKVVFEDIEEGVLAVRLSDYLREGRQSVRLHAGEKPPREDVSGTGRYFSSSGDETAKNIWGKRHRWVAVQSVKGGKVVGLAILNHPASINYPTYWHVRDYGLMSANPLGQGDFQRQSKYKKNPVIPLKLTLEKGQTVHFRFLVIVYEGVRTKEQIELRFQEFVR